MLRRDGRVTTVHFGGAEDLRLLRVCTLLHGVLFLFFTGKKRNQKKPAKGKALIALPLGTPTREICKFAA